MTVVVVPIPSDPPAHAPPNEADACVCSNLLVSALGRVWCSLCQICWNIRWVEHQDIHASVHSRKEGFQEVTLDQIDRDLS
jgi:hypothetical protein